MCRTKTTSFVICGHRRTIKDRCQNYRANLKKDCEKYHYNETVLDLCHKCSGTPPYQARLAAGQKSQTESDRGSSTATTLVNDKVNDGEIDQSSGYGIRGLSEQKKRVVGGLIRMFRGARRGERDDMKEVTNDNQGNGGLYGDEPQMSLSEDAKGGIETSEQLAKEYIQLIGPHLEPVAPGAMVPKTVTPKNGDIETATVCTTRSRFLPNPKSLAAVMGEEACTVAVKGAWRRSANLCEGIDEVLRMPEQRRLGGRTTPLDPAKVEELRKAKERFERVRDGRGNMHFDR